MNHTTSDIESYRARNLINVDEANTYLRKTCYAILPSILLWLLILSLVRWLV